jgi:2-oxoisovalerate dehydrogenase E2 component (dihydrolipoyl transacylase)
MNSNDKKLVNESNDAKLPASSHYKPSPTTASSPSTNNDKVLTTPAVRKLAKENNIDLSKIVGSGPKNRLTKEDVLLYLQHKAAAKTFGESPQKQTSPTSVPSRSANSSPPSSSSIISPPPIAAMQDVKVPIRGVHRLMVKSMTAALQVQHLTYCEEIQFDALKSLRQELKPIFAARKLKLSYMPLIVKAASLALLQYPQLNATVNADVTEITHHANHNIGVAVDTSKGLVVPVIKQVQRKSLAEIAEELSILQDAAANGTITEAQMSGGTFTVSNIGSIGGTYAVPVLVVPQVMIGAFGRLQILPRYLDKDGRPASHEIIENGEAVVKPVTIMNVSWSADHRVVDGATVARFSNVWKGFIEQPHLMLADLR